MTQQCDLGAFRTLIVLAHKASQDGVTFAGRAFVAETLRLAPRRITRHLNALEDARLDEIAAMAADPTAVERITQRTLAAVSSHLGNVKGLPRP